MRVHLWRNRRKLSMGKFTLDILSFLYLFDEMPKAFRRIAMVFCQLEAKCRRGEYTEIFHSRAEIARRAACSEERVKDFIESHDAYYGGLLISHVRNRAQRKSNRYKINETFFESMFLLRACDLDRRWDKLGKAVLQKQAEDPLYLAKFLYAKQGVMNNAITREIAQKLPTIKSLLRNASLDKVPKRDCAVHREQSKKETFGYLEKLPIRDVGKRQLMMAFAPIDLRMAQEDYVFYERQGNKVRYPEAFMASRAKEHNIQRLHQKL